MYFIKIWSIISKKHFGLNPESSTWHQHQDHAETSTNLSICSTFHEVADSHPASMRWFFVQRKWKQFAGGPEPSAGHPYSERASALPCQEARRYRASRHAQGTQRFPVAMPATPCRFSQDSPKQSARRLWFLGWRCLTFSNQVDSGELPGWEVHGPSTCNHPLEWYGPLWSWWAGEPCQGPQVCTCLTCQAVCSLAWCPSGRCLGYGPRRGRPGCLWWFVWAVFLICFHLGSRSSSPWCWSPTDVRHSEPFD